MLSAGSSVCVTGEVGIGKTHLARIIQSKIDCCYGIYKGDNTKCLQGIANGLNIKLFTVEAPKELPPPRKNSKKPPPEPKEPKIKPLTAKELKEEIADNLGETILICDRFHRWPASLKGWVEDLYENGATVLLLGNHRDLEGISYKVSRLSLSPLSDKQIRKIIIRGASKAGVQLTTNQISVLASRAGGNPLIAKRLVRDLQEDVDNINVQDGNNYRDISPFLLTITGLVGERKILGEQ